ncbi:hypothetical protein [Nonomuraea sp. NPDC049129]|uniref:hypothetical protein n=1 Tax=Nonomuraea sp. NPDC049129 TaxID=3155272 RepID=UPI00340FF180
MDEQRLLLRAVPCPLPLAECVTLRNARPAGPPPTSPTEPVTVQRVVCSRGHFQIVGQKIQVGRIHARKILDVTVDDTHITIHDNGEPIRVVPEPPPRRSPGSSPQRILRHQRGSGLLAVKGGCTTSSNKIEDKCFSW